MKIRVECLLLFLLPSQAAIPKSPYTYLFLRFLPKPDIDCKFFDKSERLWQDNSFIGFHRSFKSVNMYVPIHIVYSQNTSLHNRAKTFFLSNRNTAVYNIYREFDLHIICVKGKVNRFFIIPTFDRYSIQRISSTCRPTYFLYIM